MTTLIAWVSYPISRPNIRAIYLASDSRITWGSANRRWDAGRKLFTSDRSAHAFGYCGDVVFPSLVLAQVISAIDQKQLFEEDVPPDDQHKAIVSVIKSSFERRHNAPDQGFTIVHAYRERSGDAACFRVWRTDYDHNQKVWGDALLTFPRDTATIVELGSGASATRQHGRRWKASDVGGTSRSVFSAFCDALGSKTDPLSGGAPQLAALYTSGPARPLGVFYQGHRFLHGLPLAIHAPSSKLEWRDGLFQRVDGEDGSQLPGARRFARPPIRS
jgi:hypothetical protein